MDTPNSWAPGSSNSTLLRGGRSVGLLGGSERSAIAASHVCYADLETFFSFHEDCTATSEIGSDTFTPSDLHQPQNALVKDMLGGSRVQTSKNDFDRNTILCL